MNFFKKITRGVKNVVKPVASLAVGTLDPVISFAGGYGEKAKNISKVNIAAGALGAATINLLPGSAAAAAGKAATIGVTALAKSRSEARQDDLDNRSIDAESQIISMQPNPLKTNLKPVSTPIMESELKDEVIPFNLIIPSVLAIIILLFLKLRG